MVKIKSIREIIVKKDTPDLRGMTIPKGTKLFITNDSAPIHPTDGYKIVVVRVDNGTGHLDLMPETAIREELPQTTS